MKRTLGKREHKGCRWMKMRLERVIFFCAMEQRKGEQEREAAAVEM